MTGMHHNPPPPVPGCWNWSHPPAILTYFFFGVFLFFLQFERFERSSKGERKPNTFEDQHPQVFAASCLCQRLKTGVSDSLPQCCVVISPVFATKRQKSFGDKKKHAQARYSNLRLSPHPALASAWRLVSVTPSPHSAFCLGQQDPLQALHSVIAHKKGNPCERESGRVEERKRQTHPHT